MRGEEIHHIFIPGTHPKLGWEVGLGIQSLFHTDKYNRCRKPAESNEMLDALPIDVVVSLVHGSVDPARSMARYTCPKIRTWFGALTLEDFLIRSY